MTIKRNGTPVDGFMNGVLTKKGEFVGSYWDAANSVLKGYYGKKGKYVRDLTLPFQYDLDGTARVGRLRNRDRRRLPAE